jgi:hypothetical protein
MDTELPCRVINVHLNQDRQLAVPFLGSGRQFPSQARIVQGINAVEELGRAPGLVALKVSDQVPHSLRERQLRRLSLKLLHAILAKVT